MAPRFLHQPEMNSLPVDSDRVVRLYRSQGVVSVNLPGLPVQSASAYLCLYRAQERELALVAALHLQQSRQLVFYRYEFPVTAEMAASALRDGVEFNESMGFFLDDLNVSQLSDAARRELWQSLPLQGESNGPAPAAVSAHPTAGLQLAAETASRQRTMFLRELGRLLASF